MKEKYQKILEKLEEYDSYLLTAHPTPDGDALGSSLAIYYLLRERDKKVNFVVHGYLDYKIDFLLEGVDFQVFPEGTKGPFDCVIAFDIGDKKRIANILDKVKDHDPFLINIDHHASNRGFAHIDLIEPEASSSGEIVYHLLRSGEMDINPSMATALYAAIASDTGFFGYSNTTPIALRAASELLELGADLPKISENILRSKPLSLFQLEAEYVSHVNFTQNYKIVWGAISRELCDKHNLSLNEVSDFVEIPRKIDGIAISALFRHTDQEGMVKFSLRSNDSELDVNHFANRFGGGGHPRAAGCLREGDLDDTASEVVDALRDYYREIKGESP